MAVSPAPATVCVVLLKKRPNQLAKQKAPSSRSVRMGVYACCSINGCCVLHVLLCCAEPISKQPDLRNTSALSSVARKMCTKLPRPSNCRADKERKREGEKVEAGGALQLLKPAVGLLFLVGIQLCWHGAVRRPGVGG